MAIGGGPPRRASSYHLRPGKEPTACRIVHERTIHAAGGGHGGGRGMGPLTTAGAYYRDGERPDDLVREATMYMDKGYRTLKVKVAGLAPEADVERVRLIRETVGPG